MYRSARAMALLAAVAGNALFISVGSSAAAAAVVTPVDGAHATLGRHLLHPHPENLEGVRPAAPHQQTERCCIRKHAAGFIS